MTPATSYFICTSPRSGSWVLSDCLEQTGVAGRPREFFHPDMMRAVRGQQVGPRAMDAAGVMTMIRQAGTTENGVFAAKVHWFQFQCAYEAFAAADRCDPDPAVFTQRFPDLRYLYLTRRDKVRQAMSFYRATRTNQYSHFTGGRSRGAATEPMDCDFLIVEHLARLFSNADAHWQAYFAKRKLDPFVLVYEDYAGNPGAVVPRVLAYLGIPADGITVTPRMQRQSDRLTEEWLERYAAFQQVRG